MPGFQFHEGEKRAIGTVLGKLESFKTDPFNRIVYIGFDKLFSALDGEEYALVRKLLAVNPQDYDAKGEFLGTPSVRPTNLRSIMHQTFQVETGGVTEDKKIAPQYLTDTVLKKYLALNADMVKDLGSGVLVKSGFRSPAYQMFVILDQLRKTNYDLPGTLNLVAFPGYSEHGYPPRQAIDFITGRTNGDPNSFEQTDQYKWLIDRAKIYGFHQSYPQNNAAGMAFEPWHWSYRQHH